MGMYDTTGMDVEQRLSIIESLLESLLHDKAMSPIGNGQGTCIGPGIQTFPIINDGDGGKITVHGGQHSEGSASGNIVTLDVKGPYAPGSFKITQNDDGVMSINLEIFYA